MPKQMWFGNERRFQWVPAPATGMAANSVGFIEEMNLDNGRTAIVRSMQTHKEFEMEFPVQDASGLQGIDVFNKYASGFYGDIDSYPVFFSDQMNWDQNLFPPNWAAPGLHKIGWSPIVDTGSKGYTNLSKNPSVEIDAVGYTTTAGTSGTASGARFNAGTTAASGSFVYRATWTVATSAVSGGVNYLDTPAIAGQRYGCFVHVRSSKIQRVQVTMRYRNAADASISTATSTQTVLAANTTTRIDVDANLAPALTTTVDIEVAAVTGTSGANWANGDTFWIDGVMIYEDADGNPGTYFDGDSASARWTGTAHASTSEKYVGRQTVTITDTAANIYNLPPQQATFPVTSAPQGRPDSGMSQGEFPYALIPIPPGYTLWLGASGSATGTAVIRVHAFNAPGDVDAPANSSTLTLLSSTAAPRLNASFSGSSYQYVKVFIQRTSSAASTITISAMMAQIWPTGVTPLLSSPGGDFIAGKGHRGLKFGDGAVAESYVMVDRHLKGLSTRLVESQDRG